MIIDTLVAQIAGVTICVIGIILAGAAMSSREYELSPVRLTVSWIGILVGIVGAIIGVIAFLVPFINQVVR